VAEDDSRVEFVPCLFVKGCRMGIAAIIFPALLAGVMFAKGCRRGMGYDHFFQLC
jgi:hypothetical protein